MTHRREKLEKGWQQLQKKVTKFISGSDPSPSVVVLYMKEGRDAGVKFVGTPGLSNFAESIADKFKTAVLGHAEQDKQPVHQGESTAAVCQLDPTDVKVRDLRTVVANIVSQYVKKEKQFLGRGYYGNDDFKPPWWPYDINFQSPNDRRNNKDQLKQSELQRILLSYQNHNLTEEIEDRNSIIIEPSCSTSSTGSSHQNQFSEKPSCSTSSTGSSHQNQFSEKEPSCSTSSTGSSHQNQFSQKMTSADGKRKCTDTTEELSSKKKKQQVVDNGKVSLHLLRSLASLPLKDLHGVAELLLSSLSLPPSGVITEMVEDRFQVPDGYTCFSSLDQGDCMFSSLSILLFGNNGGTNILRLGTGLFGIVHANSYIDKFIAEGTNNIGAARLLLLEVARQEIVDGLEFMNDFQLLLQQVLQTEAQLTFRPSSYSGFLQVLFVSGFLQRKICQFIEGVRQADSNIYTTTVAPYPQQTAFHEAPLSIMWVTVKGSNTPNHVVPLQSTGRAQRNPHQKDGWKWVEKASGTCSAKLIQWCTIQEESLMVQCGNCNSWAHPECYGIIGTIFTQDSQVPFYCCKPESGMERIVILEINEHQLTMEDLISLQPKHWFTNWLIDFFIGSTSVNENTWFHCFPSVLWETLRKNNRLQIEKYQRLFKSALEKPVLVFPIVQSGHWLIAVVCKSQEITIIDSLQAADVEAYDDHCKKINRFIQADIKNVKIAVVPQQQNGSDCGPFTMHYLNQLFTKVDEAEDIKEFVLMMTNLKQKTGNYIRRKFKEQLLHLQQ